MPVKISMAMSAVALLLALSGCDGSIGFHGAAGSLEHASGRNLVRGLAELRQQINEDDATTKDRRDSMEAIAKRNGLDLTDELGETLEGNKLYHSVAFENPTEQVPGLPGNPVFVDFDIDGGYHAQMQFIVQEQTMLGFVHLTKLPIFNGGSIKHGVDVLPVPGLELFGLVLAGDHTALKARADQAWGALQARQQAASAAQDAANAKQANCEKQVQSQAGDFEVDPSASEADKQAAIAKFQDDQNAAMKECLSH